MGSFPETYNDPRDHLMDLPQVRSKCYCWLRGGVGGQFPRNV